jgi:hypothetical protein
LAFYPGVVTPCSLEHHPRSPAEPELEGARPRPRAARPRPRAARPRPAATVQARRRDGARAPTGRRAQGAGRARAPLKYRRRGRRTSAAALLPCRRCLPNCLRVARAWILALPLAAAAAAAAAGGSGGKQWRAPWIAAGARAEAALPSRPLDFSNPRSRPAPSRSGRRPHD